MNGDPRPLTADGDPTTSFAGSGQDPLDRLAEEFVERCRNGESPSISEYAALHPDQTDRVRNLLAAASMMEQLRRGSRQAWTMPERLGEFRLLRELGRGGMGVVYEAVQESLGRHVAVKVIHHIHLNPKRLERFRREAQAVARLHHSNIVPIFAVGDHEGLPYYAMQYIAGDGLDVLLDSWRREPAGRGPARWRSAASIGIQAADALQYAHEMGILHRDIKPANLLVDGHQGVWITDFGLAKLADQEELTASGDVIGTLRYLAPEALRGEADARGDIYSLGLTLYELLTLEAPFGELGPSELLRQVGEGEPTPPRRLDPSIPSDIETIVLKSIAREPGRRYASAGELADDLRAFLADRPIRARRAGPAERLWRWGRRNPAVAGLAATAAGALLLAAAVGWVGYVSTMARWREAEAATHRAEENVALSLEVFGELFERLASEESLYSPGPAGEDRPPTRPGAGPHRLGRGFPGGQDRPMLDGPGPGPGGERPPPPAFRSDDSSLLRSVLSFYERFARRNAGNPKLQGEAAWAYCKAARLYQDLGLEGESEAAIARAIGLFEDLSARFPRVVDYRFKLVEASLVADPWALPRAGLPKALDRLENARAIADQIAGSGPEKSEVRQARVELMAKLGAVLQRLGRADQAESAYRAAIDLVGPIVDAPEGSVSALLDRIAIREALSTLRIDSGRGRGVSELLATIEADLRSLAARDRRAGPLIDRAQRLAALHDRIGDPAGAAAVRDWLKTSASRFGPPNFDRSPPATPPADDGGPAPGGA